MSGLVDKIKDKVSGSKGGESGVGDGSSGGSGGQASGIEKQADNYANQGTPSTFSPTLDISADDLRP